MAASLRHHRRGSISLIRSRFRSASRTSDLILRSRASGVSKDEGPAVAQWLPRQCAASSGVALRPLPMGFEIAVPRDLERSRLVAIRHAIQHRAARLARRARIFHRHVPALAVAGEHAGPDHDRRLVADDHARMRRDQVRRRAVRPRSMESPVKTPRRPSSQVTSRPGGCRPAPSPDWPRPTRAPIPGCEN